MGGPLKPDFGLSGDVHCPDEPKTHIPLCSEIPIRRMRAYLCLRDPMSFCHMFLSHSLSFRAPCFWREEPASSLKGKAALDPRNLLTAGFVRTCRDQGRMDDAKTRTSGGDTLSSDTTSPVSQNPACVDRSRYQQLSHDSEDHIAIQLAAGSLDFDLASLGSFRHFRSNFRTRIH